MSYRVGVDIGGTFTDFCVLNEDGLGLETLKVLSRPDAPGAEVLQGLDEIERRFGIPPGAIGYFTHGSTVGVNTIIQKKGAKLALLVTEGFRDVLELARLKIPDPYDLYSRRPEPLVPRERVLEVRERMRPDGGTETAPDPASVLAALARAEALGAEAIVIAFLHAYANPAHEQAVKTMLLAGRPGLPVFCSAEVWPIVREYERSVTACLHGSVQPRIAHYVGRLEAALAERGVPAPPMVTKSNGGVMTAASGKRRSIEMLLSGTAAGAIGAGFIARQAGFARVMSLDIGGTSADVALLKDGMPDFRAGELVGDYPLFLPTVSVSSIGAGGGSIATVDALGVLRVGPESAGSVPGPACYGRGGTQATITDAFAVKGVLGAGALGYGAVSIERAAAERALAGIGAALGRDGRAAAEAVVAVSVANMYREVSRLFSQLGEEPSLYALLAFGGAGPMLGCLLAEELGIGAVIVPPAPGVLAALGGLLADLRSDFVRVVFVEVAPAGMPALQAALAELAAEAQAWLAENQGDGAKGVLSVAADLRYRGQSYEIEVALEAGWITAATPEPIAAAFHARHAEIYGHADAKAEVQVVALRVVIAGATARPDFPAADAPERRPAPRGLVPVSHQGEVVRAALFDRSALPPGSRFDGPAVVVQDDTTSWVPPGFAGRVDPHGNLILARS
jgi:N-methylhydantoinase A